MLSDLTSKAAQGQALSGSDVLEAVKCLTHESVSVEDKAAFLTALSAKGETVEEIRAFVEALRNLALRPELDAATRSGVVLDVVGTGGDQSNTFNISTASALVVAAAGVVVAKHGNRAATSRCGSADVLEALGVRVELTPQEAGRWLRDHGFAFLFAPLYHPAFRHVAPARKFCAQRGQRTIFNFLGPLLNPAEPTCQLVGVPRPALCESLAHVLQAAGVRRGMVVCGEVREKEDAGTLPAYLDELSTLGPTTVAEFYHERGFHVSMLEPAMFPIGPARLSDLAGADRETNARIIRGILGGEEWGAKRDAVLLNAGAALCVAGQVRSMADGWALADEVLRNGRASAKLDELVRASV